jgi:hypothetical protein
MKQLVDYLTNCSVEQLFVTVIGAALLIRLVYEILTNKD